MIQEKLMADELFNRLIADINKSIKIRGQVGNLKIQMANILENSVQDFVSSLNMMEFDTHLDVVIQFLATKSINHQQGKKLNIQSILNELQANKNEIIERVKFILDDNLISFNGESISGLLRDEFEWIHRATI
ncbi:hypothetical protein HDF19_19070 [Mucilaginibacter sp. E4BP6]|uniref:hypothetical protein n=1 Tax=Mucilaginibacter sp. E4BP6 TaxID=2723089 RepID=UPI0015C69A13|nr:hypothetical protein [Mucilaginibacter sp. E4BP6]NYE67085.1 hypothetical protein [Mucilaginibacter sp. E4BP6]